jgi:D-amino-acid dehydrogenase
MPTTQPPRTASRRPDPDVLIIGGGVAGLFCAYFLLLSGASVVVAERGAVGGAASCSAGNTGFVGTHGAAPLAEPGLPARALLGLLSAGSPYSIRPRWDGDLLRWLRYFGQACTEQAAATGFARLIDLKKRSLDILRELCASGRLAATFSTPGMLLACKTPDGFERACRSVPRAVQNGIPLRILTPAQLRELEPGTEFDIAGALYNEDGAGLRVPEFVRELARTLEGMGGEILEDAAVTGFQVSGGTVTRVLTARGELRPREVIIAAGAWSAACARMLNVDLLLQPVKGYAVTIAAPCGAPRRPVLLSEGKVALMPLGNRLRCGGVLELAGRAGHVSARRISGLLRTARAYLPRLETTQTVETWSGLRPCSPDGLPFLGRVESYTNLSVACGHGHIGMGLAPASAELVAQLIRGKQPDLDLAPFRISRYDGRCGAA